MSFDEKGVFLQEIEETFSPIILLSINLIMLVLSTTLTYILKIPDEVLYRISFSAHSILQ